MPKRIMKIRFIKRHRQKFVFLGYVLLCVFPLFLLTRIGPISKELLISKESFQFVVRKSLSSHFTDTKTNTTFPLSTEWFRVTGDTFKNNSDIFSSDFVLDEKSIKEWLAAATPYCDGKFIGYGHLFAQLSDVNIDPTKNYNHKGGEEINEVENQPENAEYLTLDDGYFTLSCSSCGRINYTYSVKEPNTMWLKSLTCIKSEPKSQVDIVNNFAIAVQRYEYVNVYHTMTDWYNAFLIALIFKQNPKNTTILWMDGHPKGSLDSVWETLFGSTLQAGRLDRPVSFRKLVWSINGYNSFLYQHTLSTVPYIEEFRTFFLHQFNFSTSVQKNCKNLNILFLFRHDYVAHPRNMQGVIRRKIANEKELLTKVSTSFPNARVSGVQLDSFSFRKQLEIIQNTDILVGMHGAGMTMSIFLPKHAGVIELFPSYFSTSNIHFRSIARWRNLTYSQWQNEIKGNERENYSTYILPEVVVDLIKKTKNQICNSN